MAGAGSPAVDEQFVLAALGFARTEEQIEAHPILTRTEFLAIQGASDLVRIVAAIDVLGYPTNDREWDAVADRAGLFVVLVHQIEQVDRVLSFRKAA